MDAMEANPLPTPPSTALSNRYRQQEQLLREQAKAAASTPPGKGAKDARPRRSPTLARDGGGSKGVRRAKSKLRLSPDALPRTLLPVTERKSQEDGMPAWRAKKLGQDEDKFDIAPDGGSAGREGRQFTVANVGNNGRIYLRPTVRPAHQRYPQPHFVFPITPPGTAGLDALAEKGNEEAPDDTQLHDNTWTPSYVPSTPTTARFELRRRLPSRPGHRRAVSDSTIPDTSVARESDPGGFKIVITQPGEDQRPKTVEDMDTVTPPLLQVSIPSWRLGTPRFSVRGTPFIRGSSYAPTEEFRSSTASVLNRTPRDMTPDIIKRPIPITIPESHPPPPFAFRAPDGITSPNLLHPLRSTYLSTHLVIEAAMFDSLTFKPACDDRAIVRYSSATGAVTAATPPRLVAEITSPSFLDYELLSDFFLTFRSFLEPFSLLRMLISRLRWALERNDEAGMIVRVRTFVAIRHWILNYFMDDFVIDYTLRMGFCDLLNDLVDELSQDLNGRKVQLKILAELKKCWRRVCAQYWDGPEFDASLGPDVPVVPGGIAGHRNPSLDPSFWEKADGGPPQLDYVVPQAVRDETSFYADVARAGNIDAVIVGDRPGTPENTSKEPDGWQRGQASPTSVNSIEVISCSFPGKNMRFMPGVPAYPLAAHPVDPSSVYINADPVATTPRALGGKRVRAQLSHKRNGSLTDSLREHSTVTDRILYKNNELFLTLPYAGSLVRGNLFPPSPAFVEVVSPSIGGGSSRETTVFQPQPTEAEKEKLVASAMSGQGMRKLLGSVRRALSTRGQGMSPTHGNFINISPLGPRGATTNRLPGTAIVPQARPPRPNGIRPPVRIDLLGAEVAEDFKKAVREEAAAEAEKNQGYLSPPAAGSRVPGDMLEYSAAHMDTLLADSSLLRPSSDAAITAGSKSIVIVDDTLALSPDFPAMTGALPVVNPSVEAFADSFMHNVSDPTPPNTPPGQSLGTPRRSSYILNQVVPVSDSAEQLPPFVPDLDTLGQSSSPAAPERPAEGTSRPSVEFFRRPRTRPPLSGVRGHMRNQSSRSLYSNRSGRPRHNSFTSGTDRQPTIRSFDATTHSEGSVADMSDVPVPQPLRVLRRIPGGDLRAATNVGDLDPTVLRRSRSVGSLTTFTDSVHSSLIRSPVRDSSGYVDVVNSDYSNRAETFSLGAITEQHPKRNLSLFSTHSSKPIMRPSFEAEAKKLAQIPDDVDDDGGVESALLKLEGKFEKKNHKLSMEPVVPSPLRAELRGEATPSESEESENMDETPLHEEGSHVGRHVHVADDSNLVSSPTLPAHDPRRGSFLAVPSRRNQNDETLSFLSEGSEVSYSSIPLLERGTDDGRSKLRETSEWTNRSVLHGPEDDATTPGAGTPRDSQHPSYDFVKKTPSMDRIQPGETSPRDEIPRPGTDHSFLDVESDQDSDLSSEFSADMPNDDEDDDGFPLPKQGTVLSRLPVHPLGENPPDPPHHSANPPSPPMTLVQALQMTPENFIAVPVLEEHQLDGAKPFLPTPDTTPTTAAAPFVNYPFASSSDPTGTQEALRNAPSLDMPDPVAKPAAQANRTKFAVHLPFILAFDSDILAQQFTLIEKDALNEIDWRELIEMRWKNAENNGANARSWVSFLRDTDARGVEVVIARFNIMVKWAVSEIILTQEIEERARCIIKFIHIAAHCRRYRNFATMSQITIALTSNEVSRLSKTWAMVPPGDLRTMQELETLISPTRNFHSLRAEMEGGGDVTNSTADSGCIPFVGIYTHDLLFNAQRPSEIASSPTTAPLVNFERCRTSASIIKTLLRLLEASTLYEFQPIEGITERCLWMGALTDEEIRRYGEGLE
ncbi:hypothetical protein GQ53DRAFT_882036 [Thozetella sp. PMI_491]|nr:hypothetical protein GQ53DRAFT_882036 [Thozetella sp. PMI_491]